MAVEDLDLNEESMLDGITEEIEPSDAELEAGELEGETGEDYLMTLAYEHGHVTHKDILRVFPEAEEDIDRLDDIITSLMESGIRISDDEE
ncbi:MAG: hypothetical protein GYA30_06080, partial [Chloroflexi bacterium]|nr:hypothetical protein [Chloroflexota bacterium]